MLRGSCFVLAEKEQSFRVAGGAVESQRDPLETADACSQEIKETKRECFSLESPCAPLLASTATSRTRAACDTRGKRKSLRVTFVSTESGAELGWARRFGDNEDKGAGPPRAVCPDDVEDLSAGCDNLRGPFCHGTRYLVMSAGRRMPRCNENIGAWATASSWEKTGLFDSAHAFNQDGLHEYLCCVVGLISSSRCSFGVAEPAL